MRHRPALVVFLVAFAVHLGLLVAYRHSPLFAWPVSDSLAYEQWATRIVEQGLRAEPVFHQSPGFPLLLAALRTLAGEGGRTALLFVQALMSSLAIALIVPVGRQFLGSTRAGWLGALVALLYAPVAFYALKTLPVTLAMATQMATLAALGAARARAGAGLALAAGLLLGVACVTRAEILLFVPFAALALAGQPPRPMRPLLLLAGVALAVSPVTLHNLARGDLTLIASAGGENLFAGNRRGARGAHTAIHPRAGDILSQRVLARDVAEQAAGRPLKASEVSRYWRDLAVGEIAADPLAWLRLEGRKLGRVLHPGDPTDAYSLALERSRHLPLLHALFVPPWVLLGAAGVGLVLASIRRRPGAWPLLVLCAVHLLVLLTFFVSTRLRMPLLFSLAPLAGFAFDQGWTDWTRGRRAWVSAMAGALLLAGFVSARETARVPVRETVRLASVHSTTGNAAAALDVLEPVLREPAREPAIAWPWLPSAAELRESRALAFDQAGWVLQKEGQMDEAVVRYQRALELGMPAGRDYQTRTRLGQVLEALGRIEQAASQHDAAIASPSADAGSYFERGSFRLRRGDLQGARSDLESAVALDPAWPAPRRLLEQVTGAGRRP